MMELPKQAHLYIYSRFKDRLHPDPSQIPFYMLGSSSAGNSVYLKPFNAIIDLGFPYSHYKDLNPNFFLYVDYIFLTHQHSDHLNPATLMKILDMYPHVKIVMAPALYKYIIDDETNHFTDEQILMLTHQYQTRLIVTDQPTILSTRQHVKFTYTPHLTEHGPITNVAIDLKCEPLNIHFMYASDLDTLGPGKNFAVAGLPQTEDVKFNLLLLEANYDKETIDNLIQSASQKMELANQEGDIESAKHYYDQKFRAQENLRHISEQATWDYVQTHLDNHGWFVPLHASTTFGTYIQNLN